LIRAVRRGLALAVLCSIQLLFRSSFALAKVRLFRKRRGAVGLFSTVKQHEDIP
jgi:hypothetical protein